jgi:O-antigen/teichoic acid export membrane protein
MVHFSGIKMIRKRFFKAGTEAVWVFGGQLGVAAGSLLGIKVLTHILTPYEYGRFTIASTIALMVGIIFFSPLGQGLMRYWAIARDRGRLDAFARVANGFLAALMGLIALMMILAPAVLMMTPWKTWGLLSGLCILAGGIAGVGNVRIFVLTAVRKRKQVAIIHTVAALAKPFLGAVVAGMFVYTAEAVVAGYLFAAVALYFFIERIHGTIVSAEQNITDNRQTPSLEPVGPMGKEILAFARPFFLWGIFSWMHQFCDRWSLMAFHGADVVGAFAVIGQLALYPLIFGANFLSTYFTPIAYEQAGDPTPVKSLKSANRVLYTMTGIYMAGAAGLIVVFAVCHDRIVHLVSNSQYAVYSYLLPWLTLAWALYYLGQMLSNFGLLVNRPGIYMGPVLVSAITSAIMTFGLSAAFGPPGVVAGLAVAGGVYAIWCLIIWFQLFKHRKQPVAERDIAT